MPSLPGVRTRSPGLQVGWVGGHAVEDLVVGGPADRDAGTEPGGLGESGAVVSVGPGGAPLVRLAELRERKRDCGRGCRAR